MFPGLEYCESEEPLERRLPASKLAVAKLTVSLLYYLRRTPFTDVRLVHKVPPHLATNRRRHLAYNKTLGYGVHVSTYLKLQITARRNGVVCG